MPLSAQELEYFLSGSATKTQMALIGEACVARWRARVLEELPDNTLKTAYLQQLQVLTVTDNSVTFGLPGGTDKPAVLASIAENGMTAHDMNEYLTKNGRTSWLYKGRLVHSKSGKVAFIPMEKTHDKIAEQAASSDARAVLSAIKQLSPTREFSNDRGERVTQWGARLAAGFGKKLKPSHQTDVLQGMVRIVAAYSQRQDKRTEVQSRYTVFRTVTQGGKRWHREATPAARLAEKVLALDVPAVIAEVLSP